MTRCPTNEPVQAASQRADARSSGVGASRPSLRMGRRSFLASECQKKKGLDGPGHRVFLRTTLNQNTSRQEPLLQSPQHAGHAPAPNPWEPYKTKVTRFTADGSPGEHSTKSKRHTRPPAKQSRTSMVPKLRRACAQQRQRARTLCARAPLGDRPPRALEALRPLFHNSTVFIFVRAETNWCRPQTSLPPEGGRHNLMFFLAAGSDCSSLRISSFSSRPGLRGLRPGRRGFRWRGSDKR